MSENKKTRFFLAWAPYHDSPEELLDHIHTKHGARGRVVLYNANVPGSYTGTAEIITEEEDVP